MLRVARTFTCFLLAAGAALSACAQAAKSASEYPDSRIDIYAGYAYLHPVNSDVNNYQFKPVYNPNVTLSVTGYFTSHLGVQVEGSYLSGNGEHQVYHPTCGDTRCDQLFYSAEAGPVFRMPFGPVVPFVHVLGGGVRANGPVMQPLKWGWGTTAGVGFDYVLPYFNHRFAVRPIQADFVYSHIDNGPLVLPDGITGGVADIFAYKLSAGLVVRFGQPAPKAPIQMGCSVAPVTAFPGDPLQVTASTLNTNPKLKQTYTWTSNGGKITGNGPNPTIDTAGMAPGEYIVRGSMTEGHHMKTPVTCEAPFTVRAYDPPTITCSATPNEATSGTEIAITTSGGSPQNRPLTYSYASTAGEVTSSGPTAKLSTAGLDAGVITVTCNVVDDLGKTASATAMVTLTVPPKPVALATLPMCSVSFERDKRRPVRVDNEGKGCLDDVALSLNQHPDSKLVIVGDYLMPEKPDFAEQRALNVRQYLTEEKGIDPARIELRVGQGGGKNVANTLVPTGAAFNDAGTSTFDAAQVKRHGQAYGRPRPAAKTVRHHSATPVVKPGQAPVANTPDALSHH